MVSAIENLNGSSIKFVEEILNFDFSVEDSSLTKLKNSSSDMSQLGVAVADHVILEDIILLHAFENTDHGSTKTLSVDSYGLLLWHVNYVL